MVDRLRVNRYELSQDVESRIIDFIKTNPREYVFCGEVAVHVRNNLEWTSWALDEMVHRGVLRALSHKEKSLHRLEECACVYTLCVWS